MRVAAVLLTVQVLGQTVLGFKLSIAQILVTIGVCALVDTVVTFRRQHVLMWPASAMLTGNSVALLLRATGTEHGDWWSLNGIHFFVLAALLSLAAKYLIRPGGRHLFNPSNVGLVWVLLVVGPAGVFPQYLWWGPLGVPVAITVAVIVLGGIWILRRLKMLPMALAFLVPFGLIVGVLAATGQSFWAIWHPVPVSGAFYWFNIVLSPETLIFVLFMMSDPQTAPKTLVGRLVYGTTTAVVAAGLLAFQPTEFGVKLSILSSLTLTCAFVPFIESAVRRVTSRRPAKVEQQDSVRTPTDHAPLRQRARSALTAPVAAAVIIAVAAPLNTAQLADNDELILIERGMSNDPNPQ
ncbi:MAG: RnfABCDGE type electron transport complex subunit D [Egibacteraceae bacterium]